MVENTLVVCEDLGSSPMCVTWMLLNYAFLGNYILNAWCHDKVLEL